MNVVQWEEMFCQRRSPRLRMLNPIALKMAKTPESFGHSECKRVKNMELMRITKEQKCIVANQNFFFFSYITEDLHWPCYKRDKNRDPRGQIEPAQIITRQTFPIGYHWSIGVRWNMTMTLTLCQVLDLQTQEVG